MGIFYHLFFDSNECVLLNDNNNNNNNDKKMDLSINENILLEPPMIQNLQKQLFIRLQDWFSFIEVKSQRNITMSLFVFIYLYLDIYPSIRHFYLVVIMISLVSYILYLLIVRADIFVHQLYIPMITNVI